MEVLACFRPGVLKGLRFLPQVHHLKFFKSIGEDLGSETRHVSALLQIFPNKIKGVKKTGRKQVAKEEFHFKKGRRLALFSPGVLRLAMPRNSGLCRSTTTTGTHFNVIAAHRSRYWIKAFMNPRITMVSLFKRRLQSAYNCGYLTIGVSSHGPSLLQFLTCLRFTEWRFKGRLFEDLLSKVYDNKWLELGPSHQHWKFCHSHKVCRQTHKRIVQNHFSRRFEGCTSQIWSYLILGFLHDANTSMGHGSKKGALYTTGVLNQLVEDKKAAVFCIDPDTYSYGEWLWERDETEMAWRLDKIVWPVRWRRWATECPQPSVKNRSLAFKRTTGHLAARGFVLGPCTCSQWLSRGALIISSS